MAKESNRNSSRSPSFPSVDPITPQDNNNKPIAPHFPPNSTSFRNSYDVQWAGLVPHIKIRAKFDVQVQKYRCYCRWNC